MEDIFRITCTLNSLNKSMVEGGRGDAERMMSYQRPLIDTPASLFLCEYQGCKYFIFFLILFFSLLKAQFLQISFSLMMSVP